MIPYHGTPISGTRDEVARFLTGRHALVPFFRPDDMAAVAAYCQSFAIDNSAFTIWRRGGVLEPDAYIAFCERWHRHPGFDWALIPDVIDGSESANDALVQAWPAHIRGVPVYHLHESLERAARLARTWPRLALGSSGQWPTPGTASWWPRMAEVMRVVCDRDGRPLCRLHGLRMLDPRIFQRLPLSSADSTNAAINASAIKRFGMYPPPTTGQRATVIASRIEACNAAAIWLEDQQDTLSF